MIRKVEAGTPTSPFRGCRTLPACVGLSREACVGRVGGWLSASVAQSGVSTEREKNQGEAPQPDCALRRVGVRTARGCGCVRDSRCWDLCLPWARLNSQGDSCI